MYLDNAATTKIHPEVLDAMMPYFTDKYGNASALYDIGNESAMAIADARERIARTIGVKENEIFFTSGGSESDNWAIKGAIFSRFSPKKQHIITTKIEHHAVLETCKWLSETIDVDVTYLDVDRYGRVSIGDVKDAIRPETVLISVMAANNEIGTIQDINQIGKIAHDNNILFHTDAVQMFGHCPLDFTYIDLLSMSGHKIGSPKGIGFLYISEDIEIDSLIHGGHQEDGRRAGTENVPYIMGLAKAVEIAYANMSKNDEIKEIRNNAIAMLISDSRIHINGDVYKRLPGNINFRVDGVRSEQLLMMLNQKGIYVSAGSACASSEDKPSHVLKAIGLTDEQASSSIRLSFEDSTVLDAIPDILECINYLGDM